MMTDQQGAPTRTRVIQRLSLYSAECRTLLEQSLEILPEEKQPLYAAAMPNSKTFAGGRFADSSSDEEEDGAKTQYSSPASSDSEDGLSDGEGAVATIKNTEEINSSTEKQQESEPNQTINNAKQTPSMKKIDKKQHEANIRKHVDSLTCQALPVKEPQQAELHISVSLLSKEQRYAASDRTMAQSFWDLSQQLGQEEKRVIVLFLRSGRFAGAVFRQGKCTHHRTAQRYTVRKGQGKAQSAQDGQRRPKSMGSQLRRAGEENLKEDIRETLVQWKTELDEAALLLISCPKTMKKSLYDSMEPMIVRTDARIRRVPLDLGRPTFENSVLIHDVLMSPALREEPVATVQTIDVELVPITENVRGERKDDETKAERIVVKPSIPLSVLHVAAKNGDLEVLRELLESVSTTQDDVNRLAGEDFMTPLHYAAQSAVGGGEGNVDPSAAATVVLELLENGHADPGQVDARNRPPYFLASNEKVRDAFRIARARLGEDALDWEAAKVGPPLTDDSIQQRKEKEAEKKRKKKARQKEKKAQERAQQQEAEEKRRAQQQAEAQAVEAKRIRDGLDPKAKKAPNVCDFCQKVCKGRQRSQMFKRLEYVYCTSECVQKHKRELMAKAAMARFGN
mmetsp:Transcript_32055/g.66926  ORF Transcript_32055/g.66926 Transcript_32055/m.66926 type:complete len:624 (-) Transcript_32055:292-2163(-)